jgi:hypothetical protein
MENLEGILKLVDKELEAIVGNGKFRTRDEIDSVYKLMDIAKDINKIWCMEDDMNGESYDGGMNYERGRRSYDGNSYARGRRNVQRDSMGRYSREGENRNMTRGGYSRDNREYMDNLREMADNAPDEQTRMTIQRMIDGMGQR